MGGRRGDRGVRILLDTNILLAIAEGINFFDMVEEKLALKPVYIVIKPVLDELRRIAEKGKPSQRRKARFALEIARKYCKLVEYDYPMNKPVDDLIIEYALENKIPVSTNDKELRRRLRRHGIPEIYLRGRKKIEVSGLEY